MLPFKYILKKFNIFNSMTKKKSNKYMLLTLLSISIFLLCIYMYKQIRKEKLEAGSFNIYGVVEKLEANKFDGKTSKKDIVYFYFIKNDTVFHKIKNLPNGGIKKHNIQLNDCFEVKVAKSDYGIFNIDFEEKKDTTINKSNYKNQQYNSRAHRNTIE